MNLLSVDHPDFNPPTDWVRDYWQVSGVRASDNAPVTHGPFTCYTNAEEYAVSLTDTADALASFRIAPVDEP